MTASEDSLEVHKKQNINRNIMEILLLSLTFIVNDAFFPRSITSESEFMLEFSFKKIFLLYEIM